MSDVPVLTGDDAAAYSGTVEMWLTIETRTVSIGRADPLARLTGQLVAELTGAAHYGMALTDRSGEPYGVIDLDERRAELRDDKGRRYVYRIDGRDAATGDLLVAWPD